MKYPLGRKTKKMFQWDDPGCPPEVAPLKAKPTAVRGVGLISKYDSMVGHYSFGGPAKDAKDCGPHF